MTREAYEALIASVEEVHRSSMSPDEWAAHVRGELETLDYLDPPGTTLDLIFSRLPEELRFKVAETIRKADQREKLARVDRRLRAKARR